MPKILIMTTLIFLWALTVSAEPVQAQGSG